MADEQSGYGYASDEFVASPWNFGLNKAFLVKFGYIPNGGKDGAEQDALDIVFNINGKDKSCRMFPVTHGYGKNQEKITDPTAPEFKAAQADFNAIITHIAHAFIDNDTYKAGVSRPINGFKHFCEIVKSLLPRDTPTRALDIFLQYPYKPSEGQTRTYLEIPTKMRNGAWLKPAQAGIWVEHTLENPKDNDKALWYINEKGEEHPIWKNGYFMKSPNATRTVIGGDSNQASATKSNATASPASAAGTAQNADKKEVATW